MLNRFNSNTRQLNRIVKKYNLTNISASVYEGIEVSGSNDFKTIMGDYINQSYTISSSFDGRDVNGNVFNTIEDELENILTSNGIPKFRVNQIWDWLYSKLVTDFSEMKNVDAKTLNLLDEKFYIPNYEIVKRQEDEQDGTVKILIDLNGYTNRKSMLIFHKYSFDWFSI